MPFKASCIGVSLTKSAIRTPTSHNIPYLSNRLAFLLFLYKDEAINGVAMKAIISAIANVPSIRTFTIASKPMTNTKISFFLIFCIIIYSKFHMPFDLVSN